MSQPLATATTVDTGHFHRTRMIVRRPVSRSHFAGTVPMEWQNNAMNYDIDAGWAQTHEHIMRRGILAPT